MTFILKEKRLLSDINSVGYFYEHKKTKAPVVFIENDDDNKTFSITFETPPYNDNGIAHILEHSVLCGSKKYPLKEPFVELAKGSLNTFLNAMTFADKTMYPVASKNDKDFCHLVDVYLDAVFFPNLYEDKTILQQEGWHYHLENESDELIYKGVVYNEMKGSFSDPKSVLFSKTQSALYPDTIYKHISGGHPIEIPTLTQEEFVNFHKTYYHPSNSYTFLYGRLNIDEQLAHLDTYFSQFEYQSIQSSITEQVPFEQPRTLTFDYSISENESLEKKTFLSMECVVGKSYDMKQTIQFNILSNILIDSNASPLRKALLEAGITSDVQGGYNDYTLQSSFDITLNNSEARHMDTFKHIVTQTLQQLVNDGIESTLMTSAINKNKFFIKEMTNESGFPKGVLFATSTMTHWLYNNSPFDAFYFDKYFDEIEANPSVFTTLIETYLLNNPHTLWTIATPKHQLNDQLFQDVHASLQKYKSQLSSEQLNALVIDTQTLLQKQLTPDSQEALQTLPVLELSDINVTAKDIPISVKTVNDTIYLHHDIFTSDIQYISYQFNLSHLTVDQLPYASLISRLLTNLSTTQHDLDTLTTTIDSYTGGIVATTSVLNKSTKTKEFYPILTLKGKAFSNQLTNLFDLIHELLVQTDLNQPQKLKEELLKIKSHLESKFIHQSHLTAIYRLRSYYSTAGKVHELLNGIDFYDFITQLLHTFDDNYKNIIDTLQAVYHILFTQHVVVGSIGQQSALLSIGKTIDQFISTLPPKQPKQHLTITNSPLNEGLITAQDVQYVAQGFNVSLDDYKYSGHLHVLKTILSYTYLWNKVRVQGGAYGAFNIISRDGEFLFCSYRDPNVVETINAYEEASSFIKELTLNNRELTKAIIGTFSTLDTPISAQDIGTIGFMRYLLNIPLEDIQKERLEVLNTSIEDLQNLYSYVKTAMAKQYRCIVGNEQTFKKYPYIIDNVRQLIQ